MAYGDIGGVLTSLVITCRADETAAVDIKRGDAVKLIGPYEVTSDMDAGDRIFGQAMADCGENGAPVPVRVRGICDFHFTGAAPVVDGVLGVVGDIEGAVTASATADAVGVLVKVNPGAQTLEVLL